MTVLTQWHDKKTPNELTENMKNGDLRRMMTANALLAGAPDDAGSGKKWLKSAFIIS